MLSKDLQVLLLALVTLAGGIWLDARAWPWSQPVVDLWAWAALAWILWRGDRAERLRLLLCVAVATAGECFLGFVWRLYEYRLGNLPLFVPPGHALVYAAGFRLRKFVPAVAPVFLSMALAPICAVGAIRGYDTQSPLWYLLLVFFLCRRDRHLYAAMFLLALVVESYGTSLGGWRYFAQEHWFGLRTVTRPPLWTGTFYCTLDALVIGIAGIWQSRPPVRQEFATVRELP